MQGKREFPAGLRGFLGRARSQSCAESRCVPICHPSKRDSSQHDPHAQVCASRTVLAAGPPLAMESPPSPDWGQQETCGLSQENGWAAAAEMWGTVPCPARGRGASLPKPQDLKCKQRQWPALVSSAARFRFPPRGELARCGPGTAATRTTVTLLVVLNSHMAARPLWTRPYPVHTGGKPTDMPAPGGWPPSSTLTLCVLVALLASCPLTRCLPLLGLWVPLVPCRAVESLCPVDRRPRLGHLVQALGAQNHSRGPVCFLCCCGSHTRAGVLASSKPSGTRPTGH